MSNFLAALPAFIQQQSFATVLFGALILIYAVLRPPMVRDDEDRPLPPHKLVRGVVIALYLVVYLSLVGLATIGGSAFAAAAEVFLNQTAFTYVKLANPPDIKASAPGLAFAIMFFAMLFEPVKQLERRLLVWLHRGSHLGNDGKILARHLVECQFTPSEAERKRSISELQGYNLFFTDNDSQSIHLGSVERWRKVNTLLHLLADWNPPHGTTLSKHHRRRLPLLAAAHQRKTKLALGIVSLVAHSGDRAAALSRVSAILADAPHGDPAQATTGEAEVAVLLGSEAAASGDGRPMTLSSQDLQTYLRPINEYFIEEYDLLVTELAEIASASLMQAGDETADRLEMLRSTGFAGIGLMERMDIPRLLTVLIAVGAAGFAILYVTMPAMRGGDPDITRQLQASRTIMMGAIALTIAVAALIGAYIGSIGSLARAPKLPWRRYVYAGLFGVLTFFLIHGVQFQLFGDPRAKRIELEAKRDEQLLAASTTARSVVAPEDRAMIAERNADRKQLPHANRPLLRVAPFALLPFLIVIGMCLMARVSRPWTPAPIARSPLVAKMYERTLDGLIMAGVLIVAITLAFTLANALGTMPRTPTAAGGPPSPLRLFVPFGLLGFTVGFMVLRDVRLAAHTRLCDSEPDTVDVSARSVPEASGGAITPAARAA